MKFTKITISGKICTGKSTLLRLLKKKLNWPIFQTGDFFRRYAKKHHLTLENANEQTEKLTKKIDYKVRDMLHGKGNLIVDGWMSGLMANSLPDVLKIILICDLKTRVKRFSQREKVPLEKAKILIVKRLDNWLSRLKKIYKRNDFFDKKNYDLVIDTTNLPTEKVLQKVIQVLSG